MARTRSTIHARVSSVTAFDFVSDFRHAPLWDPQARSVVKVTEGPIGVGTQFLMVGAVIGRRLELPYEIVVFERPLRLVMAGSTRFLRYRDEITFVDEGDRTRLTYDAELEIQIVKRLADHVLQLVFSRIAEVATRGMAQAIEAYSEYGITSKIQSRT